ncbi:MAG: AmmeMemoRadiSam system protein A [Spirochaetes bacterium]|nr:AmmeMemoRadiSam system protein A [Spirochaetota bacterium]
MNNEKIQTINTKDQEFLLKLARNTIIKKTVKNSLTKDEINSLSGVLKEKRGCFVTLNKHGDLRGCIGYILPIQPLYQAVIDNAYNAAFSDPRFNPVTKDEIDDIHIEISVLTIPEKLNYKDKDDLLNKLKPDIDGVILKLGYRSSTFLPQVWEQLPSKEEFLSHLCMKAGLSFDEWQKGKLEIEIYKVEAFEEGKA